MYDLISREAAIEAIISQSIYETREAITEAMHINYKESDDWLSGIDDAISTIEEMNAVPAVPLDKLCEWLGEQGMLAPCFFADNDCVGCKIGKYWKRKKSECWKKCLTKWMEGLDEVSE